MKFFNRKKELERLDRALNKNFGLIILIGKRRTGKTSLIRYWASRLLTQTNQVVIHTQCIKGDWKLQLEQMYLDLKDHLDSTIIPKTWMELFELLDRNLQARVLVLDEFPYLLEEDPTFTSRLQSWYDKRKNTNLLLILLGSGQSMMESTFLDENAPLFGRSDDCIFIRPMAYNTFCEYFQVTPSKDSFMYYSLVGGIPKYWKWLDLNISIEHMANLLYFSDDAYMEFESTMLLTDENLNTNKMKTILNIIARGATRPSEMASKLGIPQTHLSRPLSSLVKTGIIVREIPFGESEKNPKKVQYFVKDAMIKFFYEYALVHKSRWSTYTKSFKLELLKQHASHLFEHYISIETKSVRFWSKLIEIDGIRIQDDILFLQEVKFTNLKKEKIQQIYQHYKKEIPNIPDFFQYKKKILQIFDESYFLSKKPLFEKEL